MMAFGTDKFDGVAIVLGRLGYLMHGASSEVALPVAHGRECGGRFALGCPGMGCCWRGLPMLRGRASAWGGRLARSGPLWPAYGRDTVWCLLGVGFWWLTAVRDGGCPAVPGVELVLFTGG